MTQQDLISILANNRPDMVRLFGIKKIGIFGSAARNDMHEDSDIDVLVIVHEPLALVEKQQLGQAHLDLHEEYGRTIELSVVLATYIEEFEHPTPFEFHYGDDHIEAFRNGSIDLTTARKDADLAAHFTITKHYGVTLFGEDAQETFPDVPKADYLDSIARDAEWCYNNIMQGVVCFVLVAGLCVYGKSILSMYFAFCVDVCELAVCLL